MRLHTTIVISISGVIGFGCVSQKSEPVVSQAPTTQAIKRSVPVETSEPTGALTTSPRALARDSAESIERLNNLGYDLCYVIRRQSPTRLAAWKTAATQGDADGKLMLALCQWYGVGVSRNEVEARKSFEQLVSASHPRSLALYGLLVYNGDLDTTSLFARGMELIRKAESLGNKMAASFRIEIEARKLQAHVDQKLISHLTVAADRGDLNASFRLAKLGVIGWPFDKLDREASLKRMNDLARHGHVQAMMFLTQFHLVGMPQYYNPEIGYPLFDRLIKTLDARALLLCAEIRREDEFFEDLQARYLQTIETIKSFGDPISLSVIASNPRPEDEDYDDRARILLQAAECGVIDVFPWAAEAYRSGRTVTADTDRALPILEQGAALYNMECLNEIGSAYRYGNAVRADEDRAIDYYLQAAALGQPSSINSIALRFAEGRRLPKNELLSLELTCISAMLGEEVAMRNLGRHFLESKEHDAFAARYWLLRSVDRGNYEAMIQLSRLYGDGRIAPVNRKESDGWLDQAIKLNVAAAYREKAYRYETGYIFEKDQAKALKWYEAAADRGDRVAMGDLAEAYYFGRLGVIDAEKALVYAWPGVQSNEPRCLAIVGYALNSGNGVKQDIPLAAKYLEAAGALGNGQAALLAGQLYHYILFDGKRAEFSYLNAYQFGTPGARAGLAELYQNGLGQLPANVKAAQQLIDEGLAQNDDRVTSYLVRNYFDKGRFDLALPIVEKEYARKIPWAFNQYGVMFYNGWGVKKDVVRAVQIYQQGAEVDEPYCQANLGYCYVHGIGLEKDVARGIALLERSVALGNEVALFQYGRLLLEGKVIPANRERGIEMLKKAASVMYEPAISLLKKLE